MAETIGTEDLRISPARFINREASWLEFNARVLAEGENQANPLLERAKFLSIFESNLDEFYMVRVSGLIEQEATGILERTPDGMTATEQLDLVSVRASELRRRCGVAWEEGLRPALDKAGIKIVSFSDLSSKEQAALASYFARDVFPLCTPLMVEPAVTFPFMSNRSLNLAVVLKDADGLKLARVKVPTVVPRTVRVPGKTAAFVMLEDLMASQAGTLFPGVEVVGCHPFRVIRDADIEIRQLEAADLITMVEQSLRLRRFGDPVLLQVSSSLSDDWLGVLTTGLHLDPEDVMRLDGALGLEFLWDLAALDRPALKFPPHTPATSERLADAPLLFEAVRKGDVLLHHPYDSFAPVETFVRSAVVDRDVIGVKQTLYRVGQESPIVESLLQSAEEGKQVAVMVELKARFDESNNLVWSKALERAGVHVSYGVPEIKVHCKLCMVVRKDPGGIRTYVHIGTGNYNPATARVYTDLGLFTCDPDIAQDVTELFNVLTGYSKQTEYRRLLVAPHNLREGIIERIEREEAHARRTGKGRIEIKVNSLVDPEVIDALYSASQAGVDVNLVVRGVCCLRPGVPGLSERIRVVSVVGRFLEHSRVYSFDNDGEPEALVGSADMMRRNLDRRTEVLVPLREPAHIKYVRDMVVDYALRDNTNAWELGADGSYVRLSPEGGQEFSSQTALCDMPATRLLVEPPRKRGK
ncbi:MAG: polyphosphate kinase 1 [Fimbriimonadaceae bacterium]|nr:polyphosphate kinase 1 [Fimbriimonadaceae bacterium]